MKVTTSPNGFECVPCGSFQPNWFDDPKCLYVLRTSGAVGHYADSKERPGTSYLWVGNRFHLDREQVAELIAHLQAWLKTGHFAVSEEEMRKAIEGVAAPPGEGSTVG
jgi:hypothetical protein